ncbi:MAG: (2Fe-2S)-binding protein, partial [Thermoanaerobaculia bacterium]|nr:(2Fe-2S)-binding protein [Thermoanaerobaculia bacterium]
MAPERVAPAAVAIEIDGKAVEVEAGATLLDACRGAGIDVPTLCFL